MKRTCIASSVCLAAALLAALGAAAADIAGYTPKSAKPIEIRIALGPGEKAKEALVVLDQSKGSGEYDVMMADANLNGSLSDEKPSAQRKQENRVMPYELSLEAPFGTVDPKASYKMSFYPNAAQQSVFVVGNIGLKANGTSWSYMILGNQANKDNGRRLTLGAPLSLSIDAKKDKDGKLAVSTAIKTADGATLRTARKQNGEVVPHLLVKDPSGKEVVNKNLEYG